MRSAFAVDMGPVERRSPEHQAGVGRSWAVAGTSEVVAHLPVTGTYKNPSSMQVQYWDYSAVIVVDVVCIAVGEERAREDQDAVGQDMAVYLGEPVLGDIANWVEAERIPGCLASVLVDIRFPSHHYIHAPGHALGGILLEVVVREAACAASQVACPKVQPPSYASDLDLCLGPSSLLDSGLPQLEEILTPSWFEIVQGEGQRRRCLRKLHPSGRPEGAAHTHWAEEDHSIDPADSLPSFRASCFMIKSDAANPYITAFILRSVRSEGNHLDPKGEDSEQAVSFLPTPTEPRRESTSINL